MHHLILVVAYLPTIITAHPKLPGVVAVRFGEAWADVLRAAACLNDDLAEDLRQVRAACEHETVLVHDLPEDRRGALHLFLAP